MDITVLSPLEPASTSPERSRMPLSSQVNSPGRNPTLKRIRRQASLICRLDSSEDVISSHESIFHAERFSSPDSEEDAGSESWPKVTLSLTAGPTACIITAGNNNENARDQLLSPPLGSTPILYGHGTALATIVEQKSIATMNTKASADPKSVSEPSLAINSTPNLLRHRNSFDLPPTVTLRPPRRRKSFSADDLFLIKRSYHEACVMIERATCCSLQIHDIYAEPRTPIVPPIERPSTPPGMPSWTDAQNASTRNAALLRDSTGRRTQNWLQRFLGIRVRSMESPSRTPTPLSIQRAHRGVSAAAGAGRAGRAASGQLTRVAPRFRPTRSGYGAGPMETHPFLRRDRRDAKSDVVSAAPQRPARPNPFSLPNAGLRPTPKTAVKGKRRQHLRVHEGVSTLCPHRRGRRASLRSLSQRSLVTIQNPIGLMPSSSLSVFDEPRRASPRQAAASPGSILEPQSNAYVPSIEFPAAAGGPVMSGAIPPSDHHANNATTPLQLAKRALPHAQRCWKCRVSLALEKLDDAWEAGTGWCCWVFCGVDLHDDEESCAAHGHRDRGAGSGNEGGGVLGPRRVVLDGVPVMLY